MGFVPVSTLRHALDGVPPPHKMFTEEVAIILDVSVSALARLGHPKLLKAASIRFYGVSMLVGDLTSSEVSTVLGWISLKAKRIFNNPIQLGTYI